MKLSYGATGFALLLICIGYCSPNSSARRSELRLPGSQAEQRSENRPNKEIFQSQDRIIKLKRIHQAAAKAILQGHPLNDRVDAAFFQEFVMQYPQPKCDNCATAAPKYADILQATEKELSSERVTVEVASSPKECEVKYRRVLDKGWLNLGNTLITKPLPPHFYEFSCSCTPETQTFDCTYGCSAKFVCGPMNSKQK